MRALGSGLGTWKKGIYGVLSKSTLPTWFLKGVFWLGTRKALSLRRGCSNSWGPLCISSCFWWYSPPLALSSSEVVPV